MSVFHFYAYATSFCFAAKISMDICSFLKAFRDLTGHGC